MSSDDHKSQNSKQPDNGRIELQKTENGFGISLTQPPGLRKNLKGKKLKVLDVEEGSVAAQYFKQGDKLSSIEINGKDITKSSQKKRLELWKNAEKVVITKKVK